MESGRRKVPWTTRPRHNVSRQPLAGNFKRSPGARGRFEEQVDDCLSPKCGYFLDGTRRKFLHGLGRIQNLQNFITVEFPDSQQVFSLHAFSIT